jgi:hypothetical protein
MKRGKESLGRKGVRLGSWQDDCVKGRAQRDCGSALRSNGQLRSHHLCQSQRDIGFPDFNLKQVQIDVRKVLVQA